MEKRVDAYRDKDESDEEDEVVGKEYATYPGNDEKPIISKKGKFKTSMDDQIIDIKINILAYDGHINVEKLDNWIDQLETLYDLLI